MLDLIFKEHNKKLLIGQSAKKTVTRATIYKFTGVNGSKVDEHLKELIEKELIELKIQKDKITLECIVKFEVSKTGNSIDLKDSSSILKHMKK